MDEFSKIPVLRQSVSMELESGQLFLYCADTRFYATMDNDVATTALKLCDGKRSMNQIAEIIYKEYDSRNQEDVSRDIIDMFQGLERDNFIYLK